MIEIGQVYERKTDGLWQKIVKIDDTYVWSEGIGRENRDTKYKLTIADFLDNYKLLEGRTRKRSSSSYMATHKT